MPRKPRIEYPGAIHHVMSRGNRRENIYKDDVDRHDFLRTLAQACQKTDWQVHAYCLMNNHFYLVIETPNANDLSLEQFDVVFGGAGAHRKESNEEKQTILWFD